MARLARAVFPDHPHHVTQRGNGRQQTFFNDGDYRHYKELLAELARAAGVGVDAEPCATDPCTEGFWRDRARDGGCAWPARTGLSAR